MVIFPQKTAVNMVNIRSNTFHYRQARLGIIYDSFMQVWNLGNDITAIRLGPDLCSKKPRLNACNRPKKSV